MYSAPFLGRFLCCSSLLLLCVAHSRAWLVDQNNGFRRVMDLPFISELSVGEYTLQTHVFNRCAAYAFDVSISSITLISDRDRINIGFIKTSHHCRSPTHIPHVSYKNSISPYMSIFLRDMRNVYNTLVSVNVTSSSYLVHCFENHAEFLFTSNFGIDITR